MRNEDDDQKPTVLTTEEARQGEVSGHMRIVLSVSLALAFVAAIGFLIYYNY